jgi:carboxyl-terminal processing protease
MQKLLIGLVAGVVFSSFATAQKYIGSPAQDLFDQASFFLETQYFGPSTVNLQNLIAKYQSRVDEACATQQQTCTFETIEPLLAVMFAELEDFHAYYLSAAAVRGEAAQSSGSQVSEVLRLGFGSYNFCDTPTGACTFDERGQPKERVIADEFVSSVVADAPAAKAGLRYGDRITGYNEVVYANAKSNAEVDQMGTEFIRRIRAGEPIKLFVLRGEKRENLELNMTPARIQQAELPSLEVRSDNVAVITHPTFGVRGVGARVHDLVKAAKERNVRGIVLNMRDNGGGSGVEMVATAGAFIAKFPSFRDSPRYNPEKRSNEWLWDNNSVTIRRVNGEVLFTQKFDNAVLYEGALAVLVDGGCASACEYVSSFVQRAKRAPVIGTPTLGIGNTNSARFNLANGGAAGMPTTQAFWADGTPLPARITPDVTTPNFEFTLFSTGRDLPMEKALESMGIRSAQAVAAANTEAIESTAKRLSTQQ